MGDSAELYQRAENQTRELLLEYHWRRQKFNRVAGLPPLSMDPIPPVRAWERSMPSDEVCWLLTVERVLTVLTLETIDDAPNDSYIHAHAAAILFECLVMEEKYVTIARNHGIRYSDVRSILEESVATFLAECAARGITDDPQTTRGFEPLALALAV